MTDYKQILIKYIAHVAASEGICFAVDVNMAPCKVGEMEFTLDEKETLITEIFPHVVEWDKRP